MTGNIVAAGWNYLSESMDRMEKSHPLAGMFLFQIAVGIGLIGAVSGIAALGGTVIWLFYRAFGVM